MSSPNFVLNGHRTCSGSSNFASYRLGARNRRTLSSRVGYYAHRTTIGKTKFGGIGGLDGPIKQPLLIHMVTKLEPEEEMPITGHSSPNTKEYATGPATNSAKPEPPGSEAPRGNRLQPDIGDLAQHRLRHHVGGHRGQQDPVAVVSRRMPAVP